MGVRLALERIGLVSSSRSCWRSFWMVGFWLMAVEAMAWLALTPICLRRALARVAASWLAAAAWRYSASRFERLCTEARASSDRSMAPLAIL
ncbi:hypothetical protein D3C78_1714250 [compost metagenome]